MIKAMATVPVCLICDKPHYGVIDKNKRCGCDCHGMYELKEIEIDQELIDKAQDFMEKAL